MNAYQSSISSFKISRNQLRFIQYLILLQFLAACSNDFVPPPEDHSSNSSQNTIIESDDSYDTSTSISQDSEVTLGALGDECTSSTTCESRICFAEDGQSVGICTESCDQEGLVCGHGLICTDSVSWGLICTPSESLLNPNDEPMNISEERPDEPTNTCANLPETRQYIYTVDRSMTIRTIHPTTYDVTNRGQCQINEVIESVNQYILDQGFDEEDLADSDLSRTFYVHSLAVNSAGRGFISFTIRNIVDYDTSFFGVIQVPNVNAIVDCQTTILGYQEENEISFTVSTGYHSSVGGEEKLYGNLIFAQSMSNLNAEPDSHRYEEAIPRRLFEINLENSVEMNPLMVNNGLTLSELTQDNHGQLLSLYVEDGCHGDCRPREVGQPDPYGVKVKYLKLIDIDLNSESLGQVFDINIEEPYKVRCGRDYNSIESCSYNSGHNLAFVNHNPYVMYTKHNGWTHGVIENLQVEGYRQNSGGQTVLHPLRFDPATVSYNQEDSIEFDFAVIGAASVSCR